ncbi:uncharacterized protein PGTG_16153 [Puccinia graminis f. sp. tritici CRL 75-36-700-3]|uniref:Uncharacterized protein n=1 Tax=Puccinia graminis f. sp. tritici (strain CRL 75-36-700-3 / race SCCL) TaxID=418459 RepID=E3L1G8_PUCGT|nr:uncharacterized protein PGTG_16153 [Puccinia graminis f. sp. tritici CRL 75-36-700-3]EFP90393.1 hypothetical protein PGTG_16153 [Puccinia graminis f. sp. tritici CRL 75-36-700-3]
MHSLPLPTRPCPHPSKRGLQSHPPISEGQRGMQYNLPKKGWVACTPGLESQEESLPAIKTVQVSMAGRNSIRSSRLYKSRRPGESLPDIENVQVSMAGRNPSQLSRLVGGIPPSHQDCKSLDGWEGFLPAIKTCTGLKVREERVIGALT